MIDETILQQEQEAFLRDTLQMLLAQDSPTGFTGRAVDLAEGIAREQGFETRRHQQGQSVRERARPGERPPRGALRPRGHAGPDGALDKRQRHADGHPGGRTADAHAGRRILPHLYPRGQGVHRHGALALAVGACAGRRRHPRPGREEHGGAYRREGPQPGGRAGAGHRPRRLRVLRPQDGHHRERVRQVPLPGRQGQRGLPADLAAGVCTTPASARGTTPASASPCTRRWATAAPPCLRWTSCWPWTWAASARTCPARSIRCPSAPRTATAPTTTAWSAAW